MALTDTLKDHVVIVVATVAIASFGAGWAAYRSTVEAQGQELILKTQRADLERKAGELESCRSASSTPLASDAAACRTRLAAEIDSEYVRKSDVEHKYVLRSQLPEAPKGRPRFADGEWRYFAMPKATGVEVARRLTEIGPPQDAVVVEYDGSSNNTFHIWYRGQGTGTRYAYSYGTNADFTDPPRVNYFLSEAGVVPAGIGGSGNTVVPIYFIATR